MDLMWTGCSLIEQQRFSNLRCNNSTCHLLCCLCDTMHAVLLWLLLRS